MIVQFAFTKANDEVVVSEPDTTTDEAETGDRGLSQTTKGEIKINLLVLWRKVHRMECWLLWLKIVYVKFFLLGWVVKLGKLLACLREIIQ